MAAQDYRAIGPKERARIAQDLKTLPPREIYRKKPGSRQVSLWAYHNGTFEVRCVQLKPGGGLEQESHKFPTFDEAVDYLNDYHFTSPHQEGAPEP